MLSRKSCCDSSITKNYKKNVGNRLAHSTFFKPFEKRSELSECYEQVNRSIVHT